MSNIQSVRPGPTRAYSEFYNALSATDDRKAAGELLGLTLRKIRSQEGISHTALSKMANVRRNKIAKAEVSGFLLDSDRDALLFSKVAKSLGIDNQDISELLKLYLNHTEDNIHNLMRRSRLANGMTIGELANVTKIKRWHLRVMELKEIKRGVPLESKAALELSEALNMESDALRSLIRPSY